MLDFGFGFHEFYRIWLTTGEDNSRAKKAFEKCGFRKEGIIRAHNIRRGKRINSVQMSVLRPDWERLMRKRSWDYTSSN
jgi:RimJ/RimL family protein N-acetyltransferase